MSWVISYRPGRGLIITAIVVCLALVGMLQSEKWQTAVKLGTRYRMEWSELPGEFWPAAAPDSPYEVVDSYLFLRGLYGPPDIHYLQVRILAPDGRYPTGPYLPGVEVKAEVPVEPLRGLAYSCGAMPDRICKFGWTANQGQWEWEYPVDAKYIIALAVEGKPVLGNLRTDYRGELERPEDWPWWLPTQKVDYYSIIVWLRKKAG